MTITKAPFYRSSSSHPNAIALVTEQGAFATRAISLQTLPPNALFSAITGTTHTRERTYSSVQKSRSKDVELNSDLVFINHSCDPNLIFDMTRMEVRVAPDKMILPGDELTFFYPTTEWDMAQAFECRCGAGPGKCFGVIKGSKYLEQSSLKEYHLSRHIIELLAERDGERR